MEEAAVWERNGGLARSLSRFAIIARLIVREVIDQGFSNQLSRHNVRVDVIGSGFECLTNFFQMIRADVRRLLDTF